MTSILAALLLSLLPAQEPWERVAIIEINRVVDPATAKERFTQIIFWDLHKSNLHVREYRMWNQGTFHFEEGPLPSVRWQDGQRSYEVVAEQLLRSDTPVDVEVADRDKLPFFERRPLRWIGQKVKR